jgi:hypothetical protein
MKIFKNPTKKKKKKKKKKGEQRQCQQYSNGQQNEVNEHCNLLSL